MACPPRYYAQQMRLTADELKLELAQQHAHDATDLQLSKLKADAAMATGTEWHPLELATLGQLFSLCDNHLATLILLQKTYKENKEPMEDDENSAGLL